MLSGNNNSQAATKTSLLRKPSSDFFKPRHKKIDYAIFSAMPEELAFFKHTFSQCKQETIQIREFELTVYEYNNKRIVVGYTGLGTTFAASVSTLIHHHFSPDYIFLTGTAGGIQSGLKIRDVIIIERAFEAEIQGVFTALKGTPFESCLTHPLTQQNFPAFYPADDELLEIANGIKFSDITVLNGTAVSSNAFPAPKELFEKIKIANPCSIDMETSAFYQIAWLLKAKVIAIRGISNLLNHDGTDDNVHESDVKGSAEAATKVLLKVIDALILKHTMEKSNESTINLTEKKEINEIITQLKLQPHPEGGFYARCYQSKDYVKPLNGHRYNDENRNAGTAIYYLLNGNDFSAWHSLQSDEIWHHYKGSPVNIHILDAHGNLSTHLLGDPTKYQGASFHVAIAAGNWFAAEPAEKNSYCLVGCTVNPGFEFKDFKLADRQILSAQFPQHSSIINRLTRQTEIDLNPVRQSCMTNR